LKIGEKAARKFRQIAGPELSPVALRLASIPLAPDLAARLQRVNGRNAIPKRRRLSETALSPIRAPSHVIEAEFFGGRTWRQIVSSAGVVCEVGILRKRTLVGGGASCPPAPASSSTTTSPCSRTAASSPPFPTAVNICVCAGSIMAGATPCSSPPAP